LYQSIANPVHCLHVELLLSLDLYEAHVLFRYRFSDRFGVDEVVLVRFSIGFDELSRNEPHVMTLFSQCSSHEVRSCTSFQTNKRFLQVRGICQQLRARELLAHQNFVPFPQCNQVKGGFAQVDADGCDVHCDPPDVNCRVILLGGGPSH
jgi:hypothetical protein